MAGFGVGAEISGGGDTDDSAVFFAERSFEVTDVAGGEQLEEKVIAIAGFNAMAGDAGGRKLLK